MVFSANEIRDSFINFFKSKGHTVVPSAPVVPHGDPTLLFTNAGMNQFKDVFLGTGKRDFTRAVDTQKCIRVSGKHNDLEEVGVDTYHHTFFEMLGNWSFGDYYKQEAIAWAWELLTEVWKLPKERLHVTVYKADDNSTKDDEAYNAWLGLGLDESHIHWCGAKDNFWEMGETGPCGPCSEIHFDRTEDLSGGVLVNAGVPEVIEIWNNVFIQYNRKLDGTLEELPAKHVDTGMGFERICAVLQNKNSNYDTDVFSPLLNEISKIAAKPYTALLDSKVDIAMRVIADHIRTLSFAIADGASPGNAGRGYVLRRVLRRAVKYAYIDLQIKEPVLYKLVDTLANCMGEAFPEIIVHKEYIQKIIRAEEQNFLQTLENGIKEFRLRSEERIKISGDDAFFLFDTCGFPLDLTELLAREEQKTVDIAGFNLLMQEQKERARGARKVVAEIATDLVINEETEFVGYENNFSNAKILSIVNEGVVFDKTPFYAEMGGQVCDTGEIIIEAEKYSVSGVRKHGSAFIHLINEDISNLKIGENAQLGIDTLRRQMIAKNHSATHLLHEALRRILGGHVQQAGSLVEQNYLRFDFNHFNKVEETQLQEIEAMVNEKAREGHEVITEEIDIDVARKIPNVKMFFGDKYGARVRVVTIDPNYSVEFCGGTHVKKISEVGYFKIITEGSVQSGVRRIEAVTASKADELILNRYHLVDKLIRRLMVSEEKLMTRIETLLEEKKQLEKEIGKLENENSFGVLEKIISDGVVKDGVRYVSGKIEAKSNESLKEIGDEFRDRLKSKSIGTLGAIIDGKAMLVCVVTDDLTKDFSAGKIVGELAKALGGGGGGKAHMATAGGKDIEKLEKILEDFKH